MKDSNPSAKLKHRGVLLVAIFILATLLVCVTLLFFVNWGEKEQRFTLSSANITGQIETDGGLSVVEQKSVSVVNGSKILTESISKPSNLSSISVESVRFIELDVNGEGGSKVLSLNKKPDASILEKNYIDKKLNNVDGDNSFSYDGSSGNLFIFLPNEFDYSKEYVMEVTYHVNNALYVYDDVAELYWTYLPRSSADPSSYFLKQKQSVSINASLIFPIPEGQSVVYGDNVVAWGHGGEGEVEFFEDGSIEARSALKSLKIDSDMHLVIPKSCLNNVGSSTAMKASGARKNLAISEEKSWSDTSTIVTSNGFLLGSILCGVAALTLAICLIIYAIQFRRFKEILTSLNLKEGKLIEEIDTFDKKSIARQKRFLVVSIVLFLGAIVCFAVIKNLPGAIAFFAAGAIILILANWSPTYNVNYRDKL